MIVAFFFFLSMNWKRKSFFLSVGIPKLDLPPLDPYFTAHQRTQYESNEIRADITVKNVNTYGLAKTRFLAVRPQYSGDFFRLEVDTELPKIFIEGEYTAKGSLGTFLIGGEGTSIKSIEKLPITQREEGRGRILY